MTIINDQDWKLFRKKLPEWQEAFMDKLLAEYIAILQKDTLPSQKFWELEHRIFQDKKKSGVNVIMSRSKMIDNINSLLLEGAITQANLSEFSEELKNTIIKN